MHRHTLLAQLDAYTSFDQEEARMFLLLERFVQTQPQCFERGLQIGHVTGSAWIVDRSRGYVLLTHHRKLDRWLQLGGHADGNANILAVALREAQEESGLQSVRLLSSEIYDIDVHAIPATPKEPAHWHYDVRFLLEADRTEPLIISHESKNLAWVAINELGQYSQEASMTRMLYKLADRRYAAKMKINLPLS